MSRSLKKGPFVDERLLKKIKNKSFQNVGIIKTWSRDCTIVPEMVGFVFAVHNGKDFIEVSVNEEKVGHKLGEFSKTRKFFRHGGKIQKELDQVARQKESGAVKSNKS
jgi:small subunit ribosomal protein S19